MSGSTDFRARPRLHEVRVERRRLSRPSSPSVTAPRHSTGTSTEGVRAAPSRQVPVAAARSPALLHSPFRWFPPAPRAMVARPSRAVVPGPRPAAREHWEGLSMPTAARSAARPNSAREPVTTAPAGVPPVKALALRDVPLRDLMVEFDRLRCLPGRPVGPGAAGADRSDLHSDALRSRKRAVAAEIRRRPGGSRLWSARAAAAAPTV
jgi:hypothetical protein